ncbi:phosphatase PAP2 family protein [Rossellomorea vietnamensis]|uniref:Phosphatase PAP2 family protein n=1 Tax=Rossellomorea vietnamensis TaxID=218284 RepID=A0A6I6UG22_9BACI|nr:phosphatase PAP2 family protein [Rossellomorea vietnamensis]PRX68893.1 undecaprenyl-diphosphatase [Bacillus sp. V-88]QHE60908.1 phosphatase PAP2 family protein [Rossellomorea vietnamensis]SLK24648.1 undecaprenyl-diphosphatase [Bacillus sp. V-88]
MNKTLSISAIISFVLFMTIAHFVYHDMEIFGEDYLLTNMGDMNVLEPFSVIGTELVIGIATIALILFLWWVKKDYAGIITVVVLVAGSNVLNKAIKGWMERERPPFSHGEEGFSFPSGHAMVGIVFLLVIAYFISKEISTMGMKITIFTLAVILSLLAGFSRVAEQAHYPTDVAAGFLLGYSFFVLCIFLYEKRPAK